jgi:hypothetical protein
MLPVIFAFRMSWLFVLLLMAAAFVVWLLVRAGVDLITWVKEEIIDDFRDRKRRKGS